jgi:uncharacterized protein YktA (UPF0223 family)
MQNQSRNVPNYSGEFANDGISHSESHNSSNVPTVGSSSQFKLQVVHDTAKDNIVRNERTSLQKHTSSTFQGDSDIVSPASNIKISNSKKTRKGLNDKKRKKTKEEIALLENFFENDPSWSRKTVKTLKHQLPNLSVDQIYKWGYDRKKLHKKYQAQKKAKKTKCSEKKPTLLNVPSEKHEVCDFNKEVENLINSQTGTIDENNNDAQIEENRFCKKRNSIVTTGKDKTQFFSKDTLPNCFDHHTVVEDDGFFYEEEGNNIFYVVAENRNIPHRRPFKNLLFRRPSGFLNLDFYTFQEEAFVKGDARPFKELYKKE